MQEREPIMVVRCVSKSLSLGITVRHHSASFMMSNSYPHGGIFNLQLTTIKDSYKLTLSRTSWQKLSQTVSNTILNLPTVTASPSVLLPSDRNPSSLSWRIRYAVSPRAKCDSIWSPMGNHFESLWQWSLPKNDNSNTLANMRYIRLQRKFGALLLEIRHHYKMQRVIGYHLVLSFWNQFLLVQNSMVWKKDVN